MAISSYDPTSHGTGGTRIASGLRAATDIVSQFTAQHDDDLPVSAVVVVMSDGQAQDPTEAMATAAALKELPNTLVACCHFATKGERSEGVDLLRAIASRPDLFQTVFDAEQMRDFFHKSMTMAALPATTGPGTR